MQIMVELFKEAGGGFPTRNLACDYDLFLVSERLSYRTWLLAQLPTLSRYTRTRINKQIITVTKAA